LSHYKSNVRDLEFNLFEVLDLEKALATGEFGDLDAESVRQMLDEASRLAEGPLAESFCRSRQQPADIRPRGTYGEPARALQEITAGMAARGVVRVGLTPKGFVRCISTPRHTRTPLLRGLPPVLTPTWPSGLTIFCCRS
jgi:hypothetical protein